jgi:hypothetical protein
VNVSTCADGFWDMWWRNSEQRVAIAQHPAREFLRTDGRSTELHQKSPCLM